MRLLKPRQCHSKSRPGPGLAFDSDASLVLFGNPQPDRQTQARASLLAGTGFVDPVEPLE